LSWVLPTPLLLAGAVALWPLASVVRRPTSHPRLVADTFSTTLAVITAVWFG
jgi:multisubunit Na+/H+ antiporter MnhF subunit